MMRKVLVALSLTVTLQLSHVPIRVAIEEIAAQAKVNIAVDKRVQGFVSADLRGVDPQFALRAVLDQAGADYRVEDGVVVVYPVRRVRV